MSSIKIGKREVKLNFNMDAWAGIEEDFGLISDLEEQMNGRKRVRTVCGIIAHLAGEDPDKIRQEMKPAQLPAAMSAIWETIGNGLKMEGTETEQENEEVDVTLEEIEKKEPGNS